ncbi:hypothetical protein CVS40_12706 [Lucilia cuprina]|nr:hypothetical protein CVS40_12706 [Lucilia cuprina]
MIRWMWNGWINAPEIRYQLSLREILHMGHIWIIELMPIGGKFCRCRNKAKMDIRDLREMHIV